MLKKTITYTDYDGLERTEDFYFNLSKPEIIKMQLSTEGGLTNFLERVINAKDMSSLMKLYSELIGTSYGIKSDDGRRFMKSPEITAAFEQSPAYDILFMELMDAEKASEFVKGLMPNDLAKDVDKYIAENGTNLSLV